MSDLPPPPPEIPPPPPPAFGQGAPPGYTPYGEHLRLPVALAGFWIRFAAMLLDGIILGVPMAVLGAVLVSGSGFTTGVGYSPGVDAGWQIFATVIGAVYYAMLEGGPTGATLGKRLCGIRVVDADTLQPGIGVPRGIGRYFARWLSQLVLFLGYFWMLWDPRKQTWHDKLVRSVVVKV